MKSVEAECRELAAGGWERVMRDGEVVWRRPNGLFLYPQGMALRLLRGEGNGTV